MCVLEASTGLSNCFGPGGPFFNVQSTSFQIECGNLTGPLAVTAESYQADLNGPSAAEGELTTAELASYNLTYPNQNSYTLIGWPAYSCINGQIYVSGPAQGSTTVQSHH